jgi:2-oxoglutarate dehydrogenase E1 component
MTGLPVTWNLDFIDSQYRLWKSDPAGVSRQWQVFFEGFELGAAAEGKTGIIFDKKQAFLQSHVEELIYRYRDVGHLSACLDPLASCRTHHPLLDLAAFKLGEDDLHRTFFTPHLAQSNEATLREIVSMLRETYCGTVGVEYMHLQDPAERRWLQHRMEPDRNRPKLSAEDRLRILDKLAQATQFDRFLHNRYLGQKRFSIDGAEVIVALLDELVRHAAEIDCREVILGMAHRGRLNVQTNVLGKPVAAVFCEFEDNYDPGDMVGSGDVKYHNGYAADVEIAPHRTMHMLLASNPSHLEAVDPVVEGIARARQEQIGERGRERVLPVLIHGDAAFCGQGVVFETLNLSQLEGYRTGGTVHMVINNQIGFTTVPEDARSTRYSTDVAKMLMVPIFHVHGEDPEAAVHIARLACDYRNEFGKDVVIDVVCYRRYGHNEGDEPYYTQPQMYDRIKERPPLFQIYSEKLMREGLATRERIEQARQEFNRELEEAYNSTHGQQCPVPSVRLFEHWESLKPGYSHEPLETGVAAPRLVLLARKLHSLPQGFSIHPKLEHILDRRLEAVEKNDGIDWANAESLAFASLLTEGVAVRLSGQDSRRGTFSQRHSVLVDTRTGDHCTPLSTLDESQAPFSVYDSMLSENAILGFEYGYSLAAPRSLVIWEAQFGDFVNNGQVVIDQFISSAQTKWQVMNGLVLLLPHGLEGQGPEHSSGRIERFLQLCAEDNIQVCNATTPAQYFHLLRRQVKRDFRKPLVLMTPKSLLRHPKAVSKLSDLESGHFHEMLDDAGITGPPRRVLICSGKVYYDLLERRETLQTPDLAILRLEQFYPFPSEQIKAVTAGCMNAEEWLWVQEEPRNMGGWTFVQHRLEMTIGRDIGYIGRREAAAPASGHSRVYREEQSAILDEAVGPLKQ